MENPATWGEAERIVHQVLLDAQLGAGEGQIIGLSVVREIVDALHRKKLLVDHEATGSEGSQRYERRMSHDWDAAVPLDPPAHDQRMCMGLADRQNVKCRLNAGHPGPCMPPFGYRSEASLDRPTIGWPR